MLRTLLIGSVWCYQRILSPVKVFLFGPLAHCRYTPTCSAYAMEAIKTHGALLGVGFAFRRICRCHPWGSCGHDPVPELPNTARLRKSDRHGS